MHGYVFIYAYIHTYIHTCMHTSHIHTREKIPLHSKVPILQTPSRMVHGLGYTCSGMRECSSRKHVGIDIECGSTQDGVTAHAKGGDCAPHINSTHIHRYSTRVYTCTNYICLWQCFHARVQACGSTYLARIFSANIFICICKRLRACLLHTHSKVQPLQHTCTAAYYVCIYIYIYIYAYIYNIYTYTYTHKNTTYVCQIYEKLIPVQTSNLH